VFIFYVYDDITVPYTTHTHTHTNAGTHPPTDVHAQDNFFNFKNFPQTSTSIITAKGTVGN